MNKKFKVALWLVLAVIAAITLGNYLTNIEGAVSVALTTILLVVSLTKLEGLFKEK